MVYKFCINDIYAKFITEIFAFAVFDTYLCRYKTGTE